jgi:hypothetical protein
MLLLQIALGVVLAFCLLAAMPMILDFINSAGLIVVKALYLLVATLGVPLAVTFIARKNGPEAMSHAFLIGAVIQFAILFFNKEQFRKLESNPWVERIGDLVYYVLVMCGSVLVTVFAAMALIIFWNQFFHGIIEIPSSATTTIAAAALVSMYFTHRQTRNRLEILISY